MKTTGRRFVTLPESELAAQLIELRELRRQVSELQAHSTRVAEASLARQVRAFHLKFGHPVAATPAVPEDAQVRFRLALIAEEFFELLDAALNGGGDSPVKRTIMRDIRDADLEVDLPELADAMADLDYVVEGTRVVFGIHGAPIAAEVHRANMDKDAVQVAEADAAKRGERIKPAKPAGWRPPQVRACLIDQGWREEEVRDGE